MEVAAELPDSAAPAAVTSRERVEGEPRGEITGASVPGAHDRHREAPEMAFSVLRGNPWGNGEWRIGADGTYRLVESGAFPLAYGVPGRVGRLRGYGNAIVPQVGVVFIEEFLRSVIAVADEKQEEAK